MSSPGFRRSVAVCGAIAVGLLAARYAVAAVRPSQSAPGPFTLSVTTACSPAVTLTWTPAANNVTGYEIYRNLSIRTSVGPETLVYAENNVVPLVSYTYFVRAIGPGGTSQSNEVTVRPDPGSCDALLPDLAAMDIGLSTSSARVGDTISVGITVRNGGNATTSATTARIRFSPGASMAASDPLLAAIALPALDASETFQRTTNVILPAVAAGTYSLFLSLDEEHVSGDTNAANNLKRSNLLNLADRIPPKRRAVPH